MLPTPKKFTLVSGAAEGPTPLNAFDNALLASGIGNLNLIRVSSILPPGAEFAERLDIPPGSLTPTAYGYITSDVPGERIAAAVGIGFSDNTFGVIMEWEGKGTAAEAEAAVKRMIEEAFKARGMELRKTVFKSAEHQVEKCGCAFAAVALWY
ncbi:MAG: arginine decarboxylase, pyruvoyl-dependent [Firmicutes bacterium]|nr:arginine decarboxylase, pyruvoyl-dependent [Bacillota bacterium]